MKLTINKGDFERELIQAGWHNFVIQSINPEEAKDKASTNYVVRLALEDDSKGRTIKHWFNSKAIGMMAPFIAAIYSKTRKEIVDAMSSDTLEFETDAAVGKRIEAKIVHEIYMNAPQAKITEWAIADAIPTVNAANPL